MTTNYISVGKAFPADICNLEKPGFLLPLREGNHPTLMTMSDDKKIAVFLESSTSCTFFPFDNYSWVGLHVPEAEIVVDLTSATRLNNEGQQIGRLLVEDGKLYLYATARGDRWFDVEQVPLWSEIPGGAKGARAIYTRWAIAVRDGEKMHVLWERVEPAKSSVQAF